MNNIIHDEFIEVGMSGHSGGKSALLHGLKHENLHGIAIKSERYQVHMLSHDCVMLCYRSYLENAEAERRAHATRVSIWRSDESKEWRLFAHFATPTAPFI